MTDKGARRGFSPGVRIARAGGAARAVLARRGFVLHMWTGFVRECHDTCCRGCLPALYPTIDAALAYCARFPAGTGRAVWDVHRATIIPQGVGGRPDVVLGPVVANGSEAQS